MIGKTIKEAYLIDTTIPNSHNLHSTITEKLQKYVDLKDELTRIWQLNAVYIVHPQRQLETAQPEPWPTYAQAESSNA
jgi:hypothetical protein